jgi:hypothetical protein
MVRSSLKIPTPNSLGSRSVRVTGLPLRAESVPGLRLAPYPKAGLEPRLDSAAGFNSESKTELPLLFVSPLELLLLAAPAAKRLLLARSS